jgi:hypothetical protein
MLHDLLEAVEVMLLCMPAPVDGIRNMLEMLTLLEVICYAL